MKVLPNLEPVVRKSIKVELTPEDMDVIYFAIYKMGGNPSGPRGTAYKLAGQLRQEGAKELRQGPQTSLGIIYYPDTWEYAEGNTF